MKNNVLNPSASLLAKLGSAVIHAEEFVSDKGHAFDLEAFKALLSDSEIQEWLEGMRTKLLLPEKRI